MNEKLRRVGGRLLHLQALLRARTDASGRGKPGYEENVRQIRETIKRIEPST